MPVIRTYVVPGDWWSDHYTAHWKDDYGFNVETTPNLKALELIESEGGELIDDDYLTHEMEIRFPSEADHVKFKLKYL